MSAQNPSIPSVPWPVHAHAHALVHRSAVSDAVLIAVGVGLFFGVACWLELSERFVRWASAYEHLQLDELPLTLLVLSVSLAVFGRRRVQELALEIQARRQAEELAVQMLAQNRMLARQLISLQEQERRHLARELHDEIGQCCVAIKVDASTIERDTRTHLAHAHASALAIGQTADHLHSVVRGMLDRLRPTALDDLGLLAALQVLTDTWSRRHGVTCELTASGQANALGETANITLYRIVQECLTNIAKHAGARHVAVTLRSECDDGGTQVLTLCVQDDGAGMPPGVSSGGMGLVGMRERAHALGGVLHLRPVQPGGTCLEVVFPLAALVQPQP